MKCPVCSSEMTVKNFGINVDVCENGCKGMWFDQGELIKLDEIHEGLGAALESALRHPRINDDNRGQISCPKCSLPMHIHKYKRNKEVNVDECYKCGSFFLDSGELKEIRDNYMSDTEVQEYIDSLLETVPEYQNGLVDLEIKKKRYQSIQRFTSLLNARYWNKSFI